VHSKLSSRFSTVPGFAADFFIPGRAERLLGKLLEADKWIDLGILLWPMTVLCSEKQPYRIEPLR
jgi:hypothetical protein